MRSDLSAGFVGETKRRAGRPPLAGETPALLNNAPGPLDGLLVADFSRVLAGPLCAQFLSDAGARVIKVEEPRFGDETRRWGPPFVNGISAYFLSINRNKESLTLNLKSASGRGVAKRLIDRADVVLDNFLPTQRRSLGFDALTNPGAIHCRISGYDADTPEADVPGYDLLAQAGAGLMSITGAADGEPMKVGVALSDVLTAHHAVGAICAALYGREKTGRGARVDISLFAATLTSLVNVVQSALVTGEEARRHGNAHPSIVPYQVFQGSDRPFALGVGTDRHFALLCTEVLRDDAMATDGRYVTNSLRVANRNSLVAALEQVFRGDLAARWVERCRMAGIPAALVQGVREALDSASGRVLVDLIEHPVIGTYQAIRNPLFFDGSRPSIRSAPPLLGQHTDAILGELGFDPGSIAVLRSEGTV